MAKIAKIEEAEELSLTPIMNIVLVLIPLMLLNVVFMTITVINVTMPQPSTGAAQNGEPPKRLQLYISQQGFTVVENGMPLPAIEGCPAGGVTICALKDEPEEGKEVETDRYRWLELYNTLMDLKPKSDWKEHDQIEILPDQATSFGVLVKAMDIARNQRTTEADKDKGVGKTFSSVEELNGSVIPLVDAEEEGMKKNLELFPLVVLGLPTMSN